MEILILGSTGFVGKELLRQSIKKDYQVKVLVRNPDKLGEYKNKVKIITGDYFDAEKLEQAVSGTEVVLSAIGAPAKNPEKVEKYENAMINLISIMKKVKVKRIIYIGGAATPLACDEKFNFRQKFLAIMINLMGKHLIETKRKEYAILTQSGLEWIIVRPPRITRGSPSKNIIADHKNLVRTTIDVENLVHFILDQISSNKWLRKAPLVASIK